MHIESNAELTNRTAPPETPTKTEKPTGGRPRTLDDTKRCEICALIAGGFGLREAARYVRCGVNTILREAKRNPEFSKQLRDSEAYARLSPLRAMQHAVGTHWRAAAWMLERAYPDRFARPEPGTFGPRQARELMNEVLRVIGSETSDPFKLERIEKRVRGAFEYFIRMSCDRCRNSHKLRQAMEFFDAKNKVSGPLAEFGITVPDFTDFVPPTSSVRPPK
jgi:hypothetical protein